MGLSLEKAGEEGEEEWGERKEERYKVHGSLVGSSSSLSSRQNDDTKESVVGGGQCFLRVFC